MTRAPATTGLTTGIRRQSMSGSPKSANQVRNAGTASSLSTMAFSLLAPRRPLSSIAG